MLSRVADHLYWMSRYLERAKHTVRLLDVNLYHLLDHKSEYTMQRWKRLCDSLDVPSPAEGENDAYSITQALTFDADNSSSVVSCIVAARDNARQVREQISIEMWEQLNRLFLHIKRTSMQDMWYSEPHEFLMSVIEGIQLFQGITDSTMSYNEGWHFIQVGHYIERAWFTAGLIDVHVRASSLAQVELSGTGQPDRLEYLEWVDLLRSCSAYEGYRKVYTALIRPEHIVEFLLFNAESPRSIYFAATMIRNALRAIARATNASRTSRIERLIGRLCAALEYDQVEDIINDIHSYLGNIQQQCMQIHNAIYQIYIFSPIDATFIREGAARPYSYFKGR